MRKLRQKSPRMTRGRLGTVRGRNPRNSSWLHQILSSCCDMMRCHPKRKFYLPSIDFEGLLWVVSVIFGWVWWMHDMNLNLKAGWFQKLISIIFPSMIPRLLKQSQHYRGIEAWTTKAGSATSAAWHFLLWRLLTPMTPLQKNTPTPFIYFPLIDAAIRRTFSWE